MTHRGRRTNGIDDGDAAVIRTGDYPLDLAAARAALAQGDRKRFWRSLEELAGTPESEAFLHHEFPNDPEKELPRSNGVARRDILKLMAASAALSGLSACTKLPTGEDCPVREAAGRNYSGEAALLRHFDAEHERRYGPIGREPHGAADEDRRESRTSGKPGLDATFLRKHQCSGSTIRIARRWWCTKDGSAIGPRSLRRSPTHAPIGKRTKARGCAF